MKNNIYKYVFRAGHKDNIIQDLSKVITYVKRWIEFEEGQRTVWMKGQKANG